MAAGDEFEQPGNRHSLDHLASFFRLARQRIEVVDALPLPHLLGLPTGRDGLCRHKTFTRWNNTPLTTRVGRENRYGGAISRSACRIARMTPRVWLSIR